ncbi:MAG: hypothetical protein ACE5EC_02220 [Phycisphaerae bacterium]
MLTLCWFVMGIGTGTAQQPTAQEEPPKRPEDLNIDPCLKLLEGVHDHVFSFDDPAFYCIRNAIREDPNPDRYDVTDDDVIVPWQFLMERPSDYRGRLVTLEGRLLKRHPPYELPNRRGGGPWYQCELGRANTRAACTVVLIDDPAAVALRSPVRVKGYFLKIRDYRVKSGATAAGPLLVGRRLEPFHGTEKDSGERLEPIADGGYTGLIGGTAMLALFWLVLRRGLQAEPSWPTPKARGGSRDEESPDDFDWLIKKDSDE